jgi:cell division protein FtsB
LSVIITLISLILLSFLAIFQYLSWVLYFSKTVEKM